jgi:hypothetical protein
MLVTVKNPIDNSDVEVELTIQINVLVTETGEKTLNVSAYGNKAI